MVQMYIDLGRSADPKLKRQADEFYWEGQVDLDYFLKHFEEPFLERSQAYYQERANRWCEDGNCEQYLERARAALELEKANSDLWFPAETQT